ncbi:MAG: Fructose-2,6-bisphosphatase [Phormidesmis priestleyi Ana]|uniref:Fructose-2,6-bisphosphatase n=1 Tax=Phormidesmis priestleyi Ana TaxID=1666911 RepID=A0A0P8A2V6_9CYAN|nr:MAG: Fructose-2,6-bisphosphatase [Phormidesmis priestleyi Ana]
MVCSFARSITLIRHGPPVVSLSQRVPGNQFRRFVERYDAARIAQRALPPLAVQQVVAEANVVFASNRPRAMHTAELLGVRMPPVVNSEFREIEFPVDFPSQLRFSALTWSAIALLLWRMGYTSRSESLALSRARAKAAADLLEGQSRNAESVVLVAHGGINRLIAKELRKRGWRGRRLPRSQHWGCTTYCR